MKSSIKTLAKISIKYWLQHKKRLLTLFVTILLGTAALCSASLLVRSEKMAVLEDELVLTGDYDMIIYNIKDALVQDIGKLSQVKCIGSYYELGYAGINEEQEKYKVIAYEDEWSEQMYHMTCTKGNYPVTKEEVALDISIVKTLGLPTEIGQQISLPLYDLEGNWIGEEEFILSGIFEATSEVAEGGWKRYCPMEKYIVPTVVLSPAWTANFGTQWATVFLQTSVEPADLFEDIKALGIEENRIYTVTGRSYAYAYVLGITGSIWVNQDSINEQNVLEEMKAGRVIKDFYSGVLIPIFFGMIMLIVWFAVYGLIKNVVNDRAQMLGILRSIGLNALQSIAYLAIDIMVLTIVFVLCGLVFGIGLYCGLMWLLNTIMGLNLTIAFAANEYVKAVTVNPFVCPAVVILLGTLAAILLAGIPLIKSAPIAVLQGNIEGEKKRRIKRNRHSKLHIRLGWRNLLNRRIVFGTRAVQGIVIIVMSAAFFGYTYFCAMSEKNNSELYNLLSDSGLGEYDYMAQKSVQANMSYNFGIQNRHECGISKTVFEELAEKDYVESAWGIIENHSTRLSFSEEEWTFELEELLGENSLRTDYNENDPFESACLEAENCMIRSSGYKDEEKIYRISTVGVTEKYLLGLEKYVIDGTLRPEKIANGEEVVLVVTPDMVELALQCFPVGQKLPLSDIVFDETEDTYHFGSLNPADVKEPVYRELVLTPEGVEVEMTSYAFGQRKDIATRVGAIVVLNEGENTILPMEKVQLLCLDEGSFQAWGLPDVLYTQVMVAVKENMHKSADEDWFRMLSTSEGMSYLSASEIREKMQISSDKVMAIFYLLVIMLIMVGGMGIVIGMYTKIRLQSNEISYMRAVGMSIFQVAYLIIRQNINYLLVGILCAPIPTACMQMLFEYIKKQIDTGQWEGAVSIVAGEKLPWWTVLPFRCNLFSYGTIQALLVLFFVMGMLILLVTISQLYNMKKQEIVREMESIEF